MKNVSDDFVKQKYREKSLKMLPNNKTDWKFHSYFVIFYQKIKQMLRSYMKKLNLTTKISDFAINTSRHEYFR